MSIQTLQSLHDAQPSTGQEARACAIQVVPVTGAGVTCSPASRLHEIRCPACGVLDRAPRHFIGKQVRCKQCSESFVAGTVPREGLESSQRSREPERRALRKKWRRQRDREKRIAAGAVAVFLLIALFAFAGFLTVLTYAAGFLLVLGGVSGGCLLLRAAWRWNAARAARARLARRDAAAFRSAPRPFEPQGSARAVLVALAIPVVTLCLVAPNSQRGSKHSGSRIYTSYSTGDELGRVAKRGAILAPSEAALDRLTTAALANSQTFASVLLSDAYHPLEEGTRVQIMDAGFTVHQVMITSGPKAGIVGYVRPSNLR